MIHPHTDAKIYKKNDIGKKTEGKLSVEHGKHGIEEKLPFLSFIPCCKSAFPPMFLPTKLDDNTIIIPL